MSYRSRPHGARAALAAILSYIAANHGGFDFDRFDLASFGDGQRLAIAPDVKNHASFVMDASATPRFLCAAFGVNSGLRRVIDGPSQSEDSDNSEYELPSGDPGGLLGRVCGAPLLAKVVFLNVFGALAYACIKHGAYAFERGTSGRKLWTGAGFAALLMLALGIIKMGGSDCIYAAQKSYQSSKGYSSNRSV